MSLTVKTLLRGLQEFARFVFESICLVREDGKPVIEARLRARERGRATCSGCGLSAPGYDQLRERRWSSLALGPYAVRVIYAPRRVECATCGVKVEWMEWNEGKNTCTRRQMTFLARWARRLSWQECARVFEVSWERVWRSVRWVVEWGLEARELEGVKALGVDELHWGRGKKSSNYVTLIYEITTGQRRLLWVGQKRTQATLAAGLQSLERARRGLLAGIEVVCSDMWKPYLAEVAKRIGWALNVLDPFHVIGHLNLAVDTVRRGEQSRLRGAAKKQAAKKSRFLFLKRKSRVLGRARARLNAALGSLRQTSVAWELKEAFRRFWGYRSVTWAGGFLDAWVEKAEKTKLEPVCKVARMLCRHRELLLNYFRAKKAYNSAVVEGLNHKARANLARSYGHRTFAVLETTLYHNLGQLPEPPITHRFC